MARRRRRLTKRTRTRRVRRATRKRVPMGRLAARPHFYKRTCSLTVSNSNTGLSGGAGGAFSNSSDSWVFNTGTGVNVSFFSMANMFTLDMLPDYSEFTTLYDQYKINRVKVKMTPYSTASMLQTGVTTNNNQSLGLILHSCIDYDDASAFAASSTGINAMRQFLSYRTRNFINGRPVKIYFKPRIAMAAFGGGVFGSYASATPKWIDCDSSSVQHYGTKWIWESFQPDSSVPVFVWFKIEATLYFECKQPR